MHCTYIPFFDECQTQNVNFFLTFHELQCHWLVLWEVDLAAVRAIVTASAATRGSPSAPEKTSSIHPNAHVIGGDSSPMSSNMSGFTSFCPFWRYLAHS